MIVAMNTGGNYDLYLADESDNAPQRGSSNLSGVL
jgi:hypothetical protein